MNKSTELTIAQKLNGKVLSVIGKDNLQGFEKAYLIANATQELRNLLTGEYMSPIMALQGSRLGFMTDKDSGIGYPEKKVRDCLIEAVLMGVQPHGNQFNIIAGNTYITKEGFKYLLDNYKGLSYEIIPELPRVNKDNTSASIVMKISWSLNSKDKQNRGIDIPIRINKYMGIDAVIGKATRKARAWLYNTISGSDFEVTDGDAIDIEHEVVEKNPKIIAEKKEFDRIMKHIVNSKSQKELDMVKDVVKDPELTTAFVEKSLEFE